MKKPRAYTGGAFIEILVVFARIIGRINVGSALRSAGIGCDQGPANCPSVLKRAFCSLLSVA
jgi:hypothetical protein